MAGIRKLYDKGETADSKGRLYLFDNAKFILIFLVVLAHFTSSLRSNPFVGVMWAVINYFHMPAMIFISGFFAKSYISKSRVIKVRRLCTYVILYLVVQLCFFLYQRFVLEKDQAPRVLTPQPALWFLLCLILWHIMLPVLDYFKPWQVMTVSILFSLFVGYESNVAGFMAISRLIVHLPFFMAGYYIKQEHIDKLRGRKFRWLGIVPFIAIAAISFIWPQTVIGALMTCNNPYMKIAKLVKYIPEPLWWTARVWFYGVATSMITGFLMLVPKGKAVFTGLGKETLSVYILHIFLYLANREFKWYNQFNSPKGIALLALIALTVTVLFSLKPFTIPFHLLQNIKIKTKEEKTNA